VFNRLRKKLPSPNPLPSRKNHHRSHW